MLDIDLYWKNYLSLTQCQVSMASLTKCPIYWKDCNFTPSFCRLYYIIEGEGLIELAGQRYYPGPHQLFLLPADMIQSYSTISDHTFKKYWCHFTAKVGEINLFKFLQTPAYIQVDDPEGLSHLFELLIKLYRSNSLSAVFEIQAILLQILSYFIQQAKPGQIQIKKSATMNKINTLLTYIDNHLAEPLSIERLAELSHYHPNHLIRIFKQYTGYSPIQYINQKKITSAKEWLLSTNRSIASISDALGLDPTYFSRIFKDSTGYSPSSYRKMFENFDSR
jgi:AraC-like DNA-binding protein